MFAFVQNLFFGLIWLLYTFRFHPFFIPNILPCSGYFCLYAVCFGQFILIPKIKGWPFVLVFPHTPQHFSNLVHSTHTYLPMKMEQSVPKRRHIKFRRRRITQKKSYNYLSFACTLFFVLAPFIFIRYNTCLLGLVLLIMHLFVLITCSSLFKKQSLSKYQTIS
jgi:hypothetical protein